MTPVTKVLRTRSVYDEDQFFFFFIIVEWDPTAQSNESHGRQRDEGRHNKALEQIQSNLQRKMKNTLNEELRHVCSLSLKQTPSNRMAML